MNDSDGTGGDKASFSFRTASKPLVILIRCLLYGALAMTVVVVLSSALKARRDRIDMKESQDEMAGKFGVISPVHRHLAAEYTDTQGRLTADPPSDPQKQLNPDTVVLAYGEDSDLDVQPVDWQEFQTVLAEQTGKKVIAQPYLNSATDVADFKDGKIHVVALHAADTPYLVNNAGLIPVAVVGTPESAIGNHLDLAVAPSSQIKALADIKGRALTATTPVSITGHRAAVAVLLQQANMRPDVDYFINYSLSQTRSILGIANGDYEVAAWSDDKLQSLLKAGRIKPSEYRIIYQSQIIPRFTIGYAHNLAPPLAEKVRQAILTFKNAKGPSDEEGNPPMRFVAIDYKKDFEFVRQIDESFEPRIGAKPQKSKNAPPISP